MPAAVQMRFQAHVVCQQADFRHRLIHPSTWLRHLVLFMFSHPTALLFILMTPMFSTRPGFQRVYGACCARVRTKLCKHFTKGYCRYEDLGDTCAMKRMNVSYRDFDAFVQGNCTFAHQLDELVYRPDLTQLVFQNTLAEFPCGQPVDMVCIVP